MLTVQLGSETGHQTKNPNRLMWCGTCARDEPPALPFLESQILPERVSRVWSAPYVPLPVHYKAYTDQTHLNDRKNGQDVRTRFVQSHNPYRKQSNPPFCGYHGDESKYWRKDGNGRFQMERMHEMRRRFAIFVLIQHFPYFGQYVKFSIFHFYAISQWRVPYS